MKYRYESKDLFLIGNDIFVTTDNGEKLGMPRLIRAVGGMADVVEMDIKRYIHNNIKWLLKTNKEVPFSYIENTEYDSDEYWDMLTDRPMGD